MHSFSPTTKDQMITRRDYRVRVLAWSAISEPNKSTCNWGPETDRLTNDTIVWSIGFVPHRNAVPPHGEGNEREISKHLPCLGRSLTPSRQHSPC